MSVDIKLAMDFRYLVVNPLTHAILFISDSLKDAIAYCNKGDMIFTFNF